MSPNCSYVLWVLKVGRSVHLHPSAMYLSNSPKLPLLEEGDVGNGFL